MRSLVAALMLAAAASSASAADGAQSRAIGFSPDGRYFAFEQYGLQDGSGFAFSDVFVLDTKEDAWVKGTPVHVMDEDEAGRIDTAREQAMKQAKPVIDSVKATASFDTLVHMPFTEITGGDRSRARFAREYTSSADPATYDVLGSWEISVADVALPSPAGCDELDLGKSVGMQVTIKELKSGKSVVAARDKSIPKSRQCPMSYDIEAVFAPSGYSPGAKTLVALIGVYSPGFEGSNRRFIAVPFTLPE